MTQQQTSQSGVLRFVVLTTIGVAITLAGGFVFGHFTQRWGPAPDLDAAGRRLQSFPKEVGDWHAVSEEEMSPTVVQTLSCAGYVKRQYVSRKTGQTLNIAVYVGPPGPIAVHTPEICYSSRDYSIQDARKEVTVTDKNGRTNSFWYVPFRTNNSSIDRLQVYYSWRSGGEWTAAKSPRIEFAGGKLLYKLQMASVSPIKGGDEAPDACQDFLTALLKSGWTNDAQTQG